MDESITIAALVKGRERKALTARVVRKWTYRDNNGQGKPLYVGMILADAQGDAVYAEIPQEIMAEKEPLFDVGKVYIIKKVNVLGTKRSFKAIDGEVMIQLSKYTVLNLAREYPDTIPQYVYTLTPFTDMVPAGRTLMNYTDAIGYLTEYTALESLVPQGSERMTHLRNLFIKDLSDNVLKVTIWGDFAINFNVDSVYNEAAGNIVVCLLVGCTPHQEYRTIDKVYLSASSPFAYHLNPQIPEATPFYSRFKDTPIYIKRPAQETRLPVSPAADRPLRLMTIADLNAIKDPFDFQNGAYKCAITITSIPTNVKWWYMSCKQHKNSAVRQSDLTYRCPVCSKPATLPRYALSFMGRDDTGEARFFAFDDAAGSLIGRECEAVMSPLGQANGLPQALQNIINKRYVVAVNLSDSAIRQYVVRRVLERPPRRPAQAGADGSNSQAQASSSQVLQSPSRSMSALMLQSPQQRQDNLRLEPVTPLTPAHSIEDSGNTSPQAVNSPAQISTACRNLFGRQEASDMDAALSDADEAADEETDSQPARGKRRKSSAKTTAKAGSKKHASSDA